MLQIQILNIGFLVITDKYPVLRTAASDIMVIFSK